MELIVEHGPEACMAKDLKQRTPLELAVEKENDRAAEILRKLC